MTEDQQEYTDMENRAMKWLDETDTMQFPTLELLVMFALQETKSLKEEIERLKKNEISAVKGRREFRQMYREMRAEVERLNIKLQKEAEIAKITALKEVLKDIKGIHPEYIAEMLKNQIETLEKGV